MAVPNQELLIRSIEINVEFLMNDTRYTYRKMVGASKELIFIFRGWKNANDEIIQLYGPGLAGPATKTEEGEEILKYYQRELNEDVVDAVQP